MNLFTASAKLSPASIQESNLYGSDTSMLDQPEDTLSSWVLLNDDRQAEEDMFKSYIASDLYASGDIKAIDKSLDADLLNSANFSFNGNSILNLSDRSITGSQHTDGDLTAESYYEIDLQDPADSAMSFHSLGDSGIELNGGCMYDSAHMLASGVGYSNMTLDI